ncbi:uncharacterized protein LOC127840618 [Dreissena polymorpha]|uniref:uncharacterized protein LOC127840618 n=1 Tax=Dreissena polymorpha TaxID=45954 RepID=UPI002264BC41|nr:uncharacterized protein LOC127840618 [Dreissena polymorpha]
MSNLHDLEEQLKSTENKIQGNVDSNESCKQLFMKELKQLRTNVNKRFDRLQQKCEKQCSETFERNAKRLTHVRTICSGHRRNIKELKELIDNLLSQNHVQRLYVALRENQQNLLEVKRNLTMLDRESNFNEYAFKRNSGLQALFNDKLFDIGGLEESCTESDEIREYPASDKVMHVELASRPDSRASKDEANYLETSRRQFLRTQFLAENLGDKQSPSFDMEGRFNAPVVYGKGFSTPPHTMTSLSPMQLARSDDQNQTPPHTMTSLSPMQLAQSDDQNQTPPHTMTSLSPMQLARSDDQNLTFQKFSSLGLDNDRRQASKNSQAPINDDFLSLNHYTEDQLLASFSINGLQIVLYYGDLREETSDAIVNPANESLEHFGGMAYLLSKARGREMDEECRKYIRTNGKLKTTEVMHTSGGGALQTSNIIHAAGPMWISASFREKFMRQLTQTFLNCFTYANNRLWIKSLALPTISTGVYGAPLDICVRCFLYAALLFLKSNPESERRLADVRLVNNDAESTVTSIVLVQTMLESSMTALTAEAENVMANPADDRFSFLETKTRSSDLGFSLRLPRGRPESRRSTSPTDEGKESTSSISTRRGKKLPKRENVLPTQPLAKFKYHLLPTYRPHHTLVKAREKQQAKRRLPPKSIS